MSTQFTTGPDGSRVTWEVEDDGVPRIGIIRFANDDTPAYVYPDEPMPAASPGLVTFRAYRPSITRARELFPGHDDLFDAVEDHHTKNIRAHLREVQNACAEGRSFSPEEHAAWLRTR